MTVAELITVLRAFPQDIPVAYRCYSESVLLKPEDITIRQGQPPRNDGWVADIRPDKEFISYCMFPGN